MDQFGKVLAQVSGMQMPDLKVAKAPEGLPVGMETTSTEEMPGGMIYELPAGYALVPDVAPAMAEGVVNGFPGTLCADPE